MDDVRQVEMGAGGLMLEDLAVGMTASFTKTITDADVILFAGISGDTNPVHLDQSYAEGTMFKGRIAHGMLTACFISTVLGTKLPGPGAIYLSQALRFRAPVRVGDTVTARVTVSGIAAAKARVSLLTQCLVGDRIVVDGEAAVVVPARLPAQAGPGQAPSGPER